MDQSVGSDGGDATTGAVITGRAPRFRPNLSAIQLRIVTRLLEAEHDQDIPVHESILVSLCTDMCP